MLTFFNVLAFWDINYIFSFSFCTDTWDSGGVIDGVEKIAV